MVLIRRTWWDIVLIIITDNCEALTSVLCIKNALFWKQVIIFSKFFQFEEVLVVSAFYAVLDTNVKNKLGLLRDGFNFKKMWLNAAMASSIHFCAYKRFMRTLRMEILTWNGPSTAAVVANSASIWRQYMLNNWLSRSKYQY